MRLLVETLCGLGHDVDLLVYHDGSDIEIPRMRLFRAARPPGVTRVPIGISWQKLICDVSIIMKMTTLMRRNRYDVVHAVEEAVFPAAVLTSFSTPRLIYDMDSSLADQLTDKWRPLRPLRKFFELLERSVVRRATVVLAVCEDLAAKVRPWAPDGSVIVLPDVPVGDPNPAPLQENLRSLAGADAVIGLYVGNLERYQGIDLLLESMVKLDSATPFHMIVIGGDVAHVEQYRRRAQASGIADRMHFLGARPLAQLNAFLAQADVLVSPRSMGQNTPMKLYSYMQSGKAILATDIRSHTQALDAECAELTAPEPAALAAGMARLAGDRELRLRLGNAAREKAEREYSLPVFRNKLQHAYEQLTRI